ncbi:MAG: endonuclease/exonuclease/phosphatase family protein [Pseudomonadota bacterium]
MYIMCLNGWGGTLNDRLLPYVASAAPDVLCLQEVVHSPATTKGWLTYRDGEHVLSQRANFFADVQAVLPEHAATFCPAAEGVLWDNDVPVASHWGLATFVQRTLPVVGQVQGFVHKDYEPNGFGDHPRSRSAHGVRVYDKVADRFVTVVHMHGLRDLRGKTDTPDRTAQAHSFLKLARSVADAGDLVVLCGDFNVEPESQTLQMLADAGFTELVELGGFPGTRSQHYKKPGRFADYMLVNDVHAVRDFAVVYDPEVSDHCPLVLHL